VKKFHLSLTKQIFIGLALGRHRWRLTIHYFLDDHPHAKEQTIQWVRVLSRVFLSLIKMIIAPLLFSTLVVGIAGAGTVKEVGRIGLKALIYFEIVTTLALFIGLGAVNLTKPGHWRQSALGAEHRGEGDCGAGQQDDAAGSHRDDLPHRASSRRWPRTTCSRYVVFSLIFAVALGAIGEKGASGARLLRIALRGDVQVYEQHYALRAVGVGASHGGDRREQGAWRLA
jgi:Na+/H+-dicarboxylate symporter